MTTACARIAERARPSPATLAGARAREALWRELDLTPKPGLVDREHRGSHRDMDHARMGASIEAVSPWFARFFEQGRRSAAEAPEALLPALRREGRACEQAMFAATGGVNTHKGGIFSLGLACAAAGRLHAAGAAFLARSVAIEVARITRGLVDRELEAGTRAPTAGVRAFRDHGLPGARGEAEKGFPTVIGHGLPAYRAAIARGAEEPRALVETLITLMARNGDTNVVSRGGLAGLALVQAGAQDLLDRPWPTTPRRHEQLRELDRAFVARNLSPGGSADLLAITWFLHRLETDALVPDASP